MATRKKAPKAPKYSRVESNGKYITRNNKTGKVTTRKKPKK